MPLGWPTIKKLFRRHFPGANPVRIEPDGCEALGQVILERLAQIDGVGTQDAGWHTARGNKGWVCSFSLEDHTESRTYYCTRNYFRLLIDKQGCLELEHVHDRDRARVSDVGEIVEFLLACREELERSRTRRARRDKVHSLQRRAIAAQLEQMAREEKFDFAMTTGRAKLHLFVKLSSGKLLQVNIPFKQIEKVLGELRPVISTLRELHDRGISFKLSQSSLPWSVNWVSHESL